VNPRLFVQTGVGAGRIDYLLQIVYWIKAIGLSN
jgi:hypothetical protein